MTTRIGVEMMSGETTTSGEKTMVPKITDSAIDTNLFLPA